MKQVRPQDIEIVRLLLDWRIMTLQQLAWTSGHNLDSIRKRLDEMIADGIVQRLTSIFDGRMGRPQKTFAATEKTGAWLQEQGCDLQKALELPAPTLYRHTLLVNDVLTQLPRLMRVLPEIQFRWAIPATPGVKTRRPGGANPALGVKGPELGRPGQQWWVPDALFTLHHTGLNRTLLLYLEADCGTEALVSNSADQTAIQDKLLGYREHLRKKTYQALATDWQMEFNGFRLLIVASSAPRLNNLCALVQQTEGCDFVWLTTQQQLRIQGLHGRIWMPHGQTFSASILGSQYERAAAALPPVNGHSEKMISRRNGS